jgi:hypothetical protein
MSCAGGILVAHARADAQLLAATRKPDAKYWIPSED